MNDHNLTPRAKWLYKKAEDIKDQLGHTNVSLEHLIAAFFFCEESKSIRVLAEMGFDSDKFRQWVVNHYFQNDLNEKRDDKYNKENIDTVLNFARDFSSEYEDGFVSIDHIFISILSHIDLVDPVIADNLDIEYEYFEQRMAEYFTCQTFVGAKGVEDEPEVKNNNKGGYLQNNCINLNDKCASLEFEIKGRDQELKKMEHILNRKHKNNVLIVGDSGVGKTALVEYLAHKIANSSSNILLFNKQIYSLNLNSLVSGTKYRGDFEKKVEAVIKECKNSGSILFIDEIHTLVGAGDAEGGLDAANILKPYLTSGEITIIGSTTYEEYRKKIHQDKALNRRFDLINLKAPDKNETLEILKSKRKFFSKFHSIEIPEGLLNEIVELSDKYIKDTNFPDKAIDLLDLSCSHCKVQNTEKPKTLINKEVEFVDRLNQINLLKTKDREEALKTLPVDDIKTEYEKWVSKVNSKKNYGKLSLNYVIEALCHKTGMPKDKFTKDDQKKYINLEKEIKKDVIGQDGAVSKIAKCLLRYKSGLRDSKKPIGNFLFLGSTGVGKTFLAKTLASKMFITDDNFERLDMSEYSEKQSVSKLIGSSPGYVGYEKGGGLVEKVSQKPHSVILFDEIEKAHPDVQKVLLQIMEEGELTDSIGRKALFNNCVIIATGNIGSKEISQKTKLGFSPNVEAEDAKNDAFNALKKHMPLELINRFDDIIFFDDFSEQNLKSIIKNELLKFSDINGTKITYQNSVINHVYSKNNSNKGFGAREVKRIIQNEVLDELSNFLLKNKTSKCAKVSFSIKTGKVKIKG